MTRKQIIEFILPHIKDMEECFVKKYKVDTDIGTSIDIQWYHNELYIIRLLSNNKVYFFDVPNNKLVRVQ